MKSILGLIVTAAVIGCSGQVSATTTLAFSVVGTNRATGFADASGAAANGMRWGLVIDTAGDGFDNTLLNTTYDAFSIGASGFIVTSLNGVSQGASDDYFFTPASLPTTNTLGATGIDPGGVGGIVSAAGAPNGTDGIIPGVTTNDKFSIIWFSPNATAAGTNYGMFTDASFLLPASGTTVNMNAPFLGASADALKPANLTFTNIPEPSRLMLVAFGLVGLVVRRRR
jgi:hypothetical protein